MLRIFMSVLSFAMCLSGIAKAHPHIFVDASAAFIFDEHGKLQALRISWTYDEFTTLTLFETLDLDKDGDGVLNDADHAAVIDGEPHWDPEDKGDVDLEVAGKDYPLGRPEAGAVTFENNRIEVSFNLPLSEQVAVTDTAVLLRLYDPGFYYAYTILPTLDATDLPERCQAEIVPFDPNATERALKEQLAALSREDTPTQQNVGRLFSDEVRLTCG